MMNMATESDINVDKFIILANEMANAAGEVIAPLFRSNIEFSDKGDKDGRLSLVTEADKNAEKVMRDLISNRFPEHGIVGEEFGSVRKDAEFVWFLDPIDGTNSFLAGLPTWGTLIGLQKNGRPILGIMNQPIFEERFIGSQYGSFLGEKLIKTRECKKLENANLSITSLKMMATNNQLSAFNKIEQRVYNTRVGGDCYNYALLAAGCIDLVIEGELSPWDIQAHIPIIRSAGGIITDWKGNENFSEGLVVAAGDKRIHQEALNYLSKV